MKIVKQVIAMPTECNSGLGSEIIERPKSGSFFTIVELHNQDITNLSTVEYIPTTKSDQQDTIAMLRNRGVTDLCVNSMGKSAHKHCKTHNIPVHKGAKGTVFDTVNNFLNNDLEPLK